MKILWIRAFSVEYLAFDLSNKRHDIDRNKVARWLELDWGRKFDELQTELHTLNRQLLAARINERAQEGENVADDGSFLDLVEKFPNYVLDATLYRITYDLNPLLKSFCDSKYQSVCEMSLPLYLASYGWFDHLAQVVAAAANCCRDSCLLSKLPLHIWPGYLLLDSCLGNRVEDKERRDNVLYLLIEKARSKKIPLFEMYGICLEALCQHENVVGLHNLVLVVAGNELLTLKELREVLTTPGYLLFNESLLEWCLVHSSKEIYKILLSLFPKDDEKLYELLTKSTVRWMGDKGPWPLIKMVTEKREEALETVLGYCKPFTDEKKKKFQSQLGEQSLSQKMILLLKDQIRGYLVPQGLEGARKVALLYFNIAGRRGGKEEADTVDRVLDNLGFQVIRKCNWTAKRLLPDIQQNIAQVKGNCSLLAIFIMAHGSDDRIYGVDEQPVKIDDVDKIINFKTEGIPKEIPKEIPKGIPKGIPKITFIQACRKQDPQTGETNRVSYDETTRIRLSGKFNFQDYGRVMAAVEGEEAFRNTMMPILMEELEQGGEMADIIGRVRERMAMLKNPVKGNMVTQEKYNLRDLIIM